jgi:alpha-L-rhamnosidase
MNKPLAAALTILISAMPGMKGIYGQDLSKKSPATQPYPYISSGKFVGPENPFSPDPLVTYRWPDPKAGDGLEIYMESPKTVFTDKPGSFNNLASLTGGQPDVTVNGTGSIRIDFGRELGAWIEFDSPDCPGGVEMSISEYNEPGVDKTAEPKRYGSTWRLELNPELYDGVRFAWIHVKTFTSAWHITNVRAVCQVKPVNYNGSFSCSDPLLARAWYMSAYGVKVSLCRDYFGAILMERGDRMSWTGDAHTSQAAALAAFGNWDFIRKNIDNTSGQDNGIRSYSLYWVLSLLDYYQYTGDKATMAAFLDNACKKLDAANKVFGTNPGLRFYGWDERLCSGFEIWFRESPEAQNAYKMLSIRAWHDFAVAMGHFGRNDLENKYKNIASARIAELRMSPSWHMGFGLHAAADAICTGMLTTGESEYLYNKWFTDRVNRLSISPFNQYFIIGAMARQGKHDDALSSVRDMWGGMVDYGGTTPFETYRPTWNRIVGMNNAVPNTQSGITSLCHPWGAGVVKWLNEEIAGLVPLTPGFKEWAILPHPGRTLKQVSAATPTPFGTLSASLDLSSGKFLVTAPAGTIGRIGIPKTERTVARISVNGKLAWDGAFRMVPGIRGASEDDSFVYFDGVEPGAYALSVKYKGKTPEYTEDPEVYAARFIGTDSLTGGNWGGRYGKDGYVLCNYDGEGIDRKKLPVWVTSVDYYRAFPKSGSPDPTTWVTATNEPRAPAPDSGNGFPRTAACVSNSDQTMSVTIGIEGSRNFNIALYFIDWNNEGCRSAVEIFDAETLNLISPVQIVKNHRGGAYLIYSYNRSVKFRIDKIRGGNISLSGIFFDAGN